MSYLDPPPPGQDVIYRPTVGVVLFHRADPCGCTTTEYLSPSPSTVMAYRDLRCEAHDNPFIPYET